MNTAGRPSLRCCNSGCVSSVWPVGLDGPVLSGGGLQWHAAGAAGGPERTAEAVSWEVAGSAHRGTLPPS